MTPVVGKLDSTLLKRNAIAVRHAIDRLHSPTNVLLVCEIIIKFIHVIVRLDKKLVGLDM